MPGGKLPLLVPFRKTFPLLDNFILLPLPTAHPTDQQATTARNARRLLAKGLNVPIIGVAQSNRLASRGKEHLSVNDLRDSGAIENDASVVILINGARKPDHEWSAAEPVRFLQLHIAKNRYGPTGDPEDPLELTWWPAMGRIEDSAPVGTESIP